MRNHLWYLLEETTLQVIYIDELLRLQYKLNRGIDIALFFISGFGVISLEYMNNQTLAIISLYITASIALIKLFGKPWIISQKELDKLSNIYFKYKNIKMDIRDAWYEYSDSENQVIKEVLNNLNSRMVKLEKECCDLDIHESSIAKRRAHNQLKKQMAIYYE